MFKYTQLIGSWFEYLRHEWILKLNLLKIFLSNIFFSFINSVSNLQHWDILKCSQIHTEVFLDIGPTTFETSSIKISSGEGINAIAQQSFLLFPPLSYFALFIRLIEKIMNWWYALKYCGNNFRRLKYRVQKW